MSKKRIIIILRSLTGIFFLGITILWSMQAPALQAVTFRVNTTDDTVDVNPGDGTAADSSGKCSLRAAIMEANALAGKDTIELAAGTFTLKIHGIDEDNCETGDLDIKSSLTIQGEGKNVTIIDGDQLDRVLHIKGKYNVDLADLTITGGKSPDGKNITIPSVLSPFKGKNINGEMISLEDYYQAQLKQRVNLNIIMAEMAHVTRNFTRAPDKGKDLKIPTLQTDAGDLGGGILNVKATLVIDRCKITANETGKGGFTESYGGGRGGNGGGIFNDEGTITLNYSEISQNNTGSHGVGDGFSSGDGGSGSGLYNHEGTVTLNHCTVKKNNTGLGGNLRGRGGHGAGLYNSYGNLSIDHCEISFNACGYAGGYDTGGGGSGGGIYNWGDLTVNNSNIASNSSGNSVSHGCGGEGGGVCTGSNTLSVISNSLISGNIAGENDEFEGGCGGGILNYGKLSMINCTITGNRTQPWMTLGGGIANSSLMILKSCTIARNHADDYGGGVCNLWGPDWLLIIQNCIIADNTDGSGNGRDTAGGNIRSDGYNLVEDQGAYTTIGGDESTNIYGQDPGLEALANNGGPTRTMALTKGSVCIDAGDPDDYETTDQRGVLRPQDGDGDGAALPDIGAYEVFTPRVEITSPANGATVFATVDITVDANTQNVDFFIAGTLMHSDDTAPFTYAWDSSTIGNGSRKIEAKGYDIAGSYAATDKINVNVNNTVISLEVSHHKESAWLVHKYSGKVFFTVTQTGAGSPVSYIIERKQGTGSFSSIKTVAVSELTGGSYTFYDTPVDKSITYIYRVKAMDSNNATVGISAEKTLPGN